MVCRADVLGAQVTRRNEIDNTLEDLIEDASHSKTLEKYSDYFVNDEKRHSDFERMIPRQKFRAGVFIPVNGSLVTQLNKRKGCCEALNSRIQIIRNLHEKKYEDVTKKYDILHSTLPERHQ
ncbi:hypothetical protein TNCV_1704821 [Trichonephila clavipes]|nr:hypothetical protein TNCV_1704821 [Trichonephila clavipes]